MRVTLVLHPSGVLYVAGNENDFELVDTDEFDLYTFRFRNFDAPQV